MKTEKKSWAALVRRGKWLTFKLRFYCALARVTRFGLHGFVLWRIRAINEAGIIHNRQVDQAVRENRRLAAIARKGGVK